MVRVSALWAVRSAQAVILPTVTMPQINTKLEQARRHLLDLSHRNRLLNFVATRGVVIPFFGSVTGSPLATRTSRSSVVV